MSQKIQKEYLAIIVTLLTLNLFVTGYLIFKNNHKQVDSNTATNFEILNTENDAESDVEISENNEDMNEIIPSTSVIPTKKGENTITAVISNTIMPPKKEVKQDNKISFVILTRSPYANSDYWKVYGSIVISSGSKITKSQHKLTITYKNYELKIAGNDNMNDSVFKPYIVLPGYHKIGKIKLISADDKSYISPDVYRVAYQTAGNIFYTNNFEKNKKCEVASYSENPPCAWPTISFSTKTFIWASLDCGAEQPSQECLNWGDNIVKTLELKH